MKISLLFIILFLNLGCSQKLFKAKYIKRSKASDTVSIPVAPTSVETDAVEDCAKVYFIFPTKLRWNKEVLYQNICPKSESLHNVTITREFFTIPLIYSKDCLVLKAECGQ